MANTLKNSSFAVSKFVITLAAVVLLTGAANLKIAAKKLETERLAVPESSPDDEKPGTKILEPEMAIPTDELPAPGEMQENDETEPNEVQNTNPRVSGPPPEVMRDISKLPEVVRQTRQNILDAAATGDINKLRFLIGSGENATDLSIGGIEGDPIEHLKAVSGDADGQEILAILTEIFEAGYVHVDAGKEDEMYIWPYFFAWPLDKLTPPMRVELFRILTAGDLEDSAQSGAYIFYRAGIKPDGTWNFFVAGD